MSAVTATHDIPSTMYYYYSHKKNIYLETTIIILIVLVCIIQIIRSDKPFPYKETKEYMYKWFTFSNKYFFSTVLGTTEVYHP